MNDKERFRLYNKAIKKWGKESQVMMLFEEIGELFQAISKYDRDPCTPHFHQVIEEIGDVEIMLEQLRLIVGAPSGYVAKSKKFKLEKLKKVLR